MEDVEEFEKGSTKKGILLLETKIKLQMPSIKDSKINMRPHPFRSLKITSSMPAVPGSSNSGLDSLKMAAMGGLDLQRSHSVKERLDKDR
ncbi:uncharacterized protein G2W53_015663 [Senna tora]|uniref:Uncharacterized protein n=1 Tax=Senna tora TaxID=362788 RepID=A0A834WV76_9FABA|nr:uncharacterized protein G2W53_015663 [Senna tora]